MILSASTLAACAAEIPQWQRLLDAITYDRQVSLRPEEQADLAAYVENRRTGVSRYYRSYSGLHRLMTPLQDVFHHIGAGRSAYQGSLIVLLQEMHRRQTTFWGWTHSEWVETICADGSAFEARYGIIRGFRLPLKAVSYFFGGITDLHCFGIFCQQEFAEKVFGVSPVREAITTVFEEATRLGYENRRELIRALCEALLASRSPYLQEVTVHTLEHLRTLRTSAKITIPLFTIHRILVSLGLLNTALAPLEGTKRRKEREQHITLAGIAPEWVHWFQRWRDSSTDASRTRKRSYYSLLKLGRWVTAAHPEVISPHQWSRDLAIEFVAAVDRMSIGEWAMPLGHTAGKPLSARSKAGLLRDVRTFFRDCQEWGWLPHTFDPARALATPRSLYKLIGPNPRVIEDDIWCKLIWAGLNLTAEDLPAHVIPSTARTQPRFYFHYPLEMVRAIAVTWLFAGLRSDELCRLRLGCIRWQPQQEGKLTSICWLDIPTNKTGTAFTKPVDRLVGEAILAWEAARPPQRTLPDPKTGELVHYLFSYRGKRLGKSYLNNGLIPALCRKAGVPEADARGNITSHRARSTIASQLFNAREPMSLFELQEWLGHRSPASTQHYAKVTPTRLARAFTEAGYFERNTRMIEVLIDQEAIRNGAAAAGEPWKFYDLGHGYCTYEFFEQCPHRMACAQCSFYQPKGSSQAQMLEAKANLQRMLQAIPL